MSNKTTELSQYKATLEIIEQETRMMDQLKFGTKDLELDMLRTHNLKLGLWVRNALNQHRPQAEDSVTPIK